MSDRKDDPPSSFSSADPVRNFTISTEERIRAITIGVPAYAARKRRIEDREDEMLAALVDLHDALVEKASPRDAVTRAIEAKARSFDLDRINALIDLHNRYYPIEANLPMDRSGNYRLFGRPWMPEEHWTVERLLARFASAIAARG